MKSLLFALLLGLITGCGSGVFNYTKPDGTKVSGAWIHVIADPTVTGVKIATTQGSVELDGFHSEAKMTAMDLLQVISAIAKTGVKP